jgi:hypothetical protein
MGDIAEDSSYASRSGLTAAAAAAGGDKGASSTSLSNDSATNAVMTRPMSIGAGGRKRAVSTRKATWEADILVEAAEAVVAPATTATTTPTATATKEADELNANPTTPAASEASI